MKVRLAACASMLVANLASAQSTPSAEQMALDATYGIAPQPPRAADLFRRARALESARFRGTLYCEVEVEGEEWDGRATNGPVQRYMGRVELDAEVGLPGRDDLVRYRGPADTNRVVFAIAGVDTATGSSISVALADRDVLANDPIGRITLTYGGSLPIRGTTEHAAIECRGVPAEALESDVEDAVRAADTAIARLDGASSPDAALPGFRSSAADPNGALRAVFEIARITGLADPRFLERRDALRAREAGFIGARAALVEEIEKNAPIVGTSFRLPGASITATVERVDCAIEDMIGLHSELGLDVPMECAISLRIRNDGAAATFTWGLHVVDDLGDTIELTRFGRRDDSGVTRLRTLRLERGENLWVAASPTHRATLLRLSRRRAVAWARLGDGAVNEPTPRPGELGNPTNPASPSR